MNRTQIEWVRGDDGTPGYTWNPVTGCSKVSPGCAYCWAETVSHRHGDTAEPWTPAHVAANVRLHPERLDQPLRTQTPARVFVCSMSDLFHEQVPDEFINQVFAVMAAAPEHTFIVLTKRAERLRDYLTTPDRDEMVGWAAHLLYEEWGDSRVGRRIAPAATLIHAQGAYPMGPASAAIASATGTVQPRWPLANVWVGVTVENQYWADERIPLLLQTPAAVRWLSIEPLLGRIHFREVPCNGTVATFEGGHWVSTARIDWIVAGGESCGPPDRALVKRCGNCGGGAPSSSCYACRGEPWQPKAAALGWARALRDQAVAAGVPFLWKQWGGPTSKSGGRELEGVVWQQFPAARS